MLLKIYNSTETIRKIEKFFFCRKNKKSTKIQKIAIKLFALEPVNFERILKFATLRFEEKYYFSYFLLNFENRGKFFGRFIIRAKY